MKFIVQHSSVKYNGTYYREGDTLDAPSLPVGLEELLVPLTEPSAKEQEQQPKPKKK